MSEQQDRKLRTDLDRGLYRKFTVQRTDGRSAPGEKHENCHYFVLDLIHDPLARPALQAYRKAAINAGFHQLANDLTLEIEAMILKGW